MHIAGDLKKVFTQILFVSLDNFPPSILQPYSLAGSFGRDNVGGSETLSVSSATIHFKLHHPHLFNYTS